MRRREVVIILMILAVCLIGCDRKKIDCETLRSKTVFDPVDESYEYRPRGFDEAEYPEYPYSEVVGSRENGDGYGI